MPLHPGTTAALALMLAATPVFAGGTDALPAGVDPVTGYRMERYRAPVPPVLPGGRVIGIAEVKTAASDGRTVLVDVYPVRQGRVRDDGSWILAEDRFSIPGSVWIANAGLGALDPDTEDYVRRSLRGLTGGDTAVPLAFYCASDCWHSWNAARRAIVWGYTAVSWYPDGSEGWAENGGELVWAEPLNFLDPAAP